MHEPGSYYTQAHISELLVNQLNYHQPKRILDLGAGHGALTKAAKMRWPDANIHAVETHGQGYSFLKLRYPAVQSQRLDGLNVQLPIHLGIEPESIDVAVCNPPYLKFKNNQEFQKLFLGAYLPNCVKLPNLTTDILFLAQNLRLLCKGGELGIIVPDGLLTNKSLRPLREDLFTNHQVFAVIELPAKIFPHTEAKTHILLIKRGYTSLNAIPIHLANINGQITETITVKPDDLQERMDFRYWKWRSRNNLINGSFSLAEIGADIRRGSHSKSYFTNLNEHFFHTSDIPSTPTIIDLPHKTCIPTGLVARQGDILLARVGKRCLGKVALVASGEVGITDCVYRIRLPVKFQERIFNALASDNGQAWLKAHAHGVCARVISKVDLLRFQALLD